VHDDIKHSQFEESPDELSTPRWQEVSSISVVVTFSDALFAVWWSFGA